MSEIDTPRRPGPWDPRPEDLKAAAAPAPEPARAAEPPLDKGQNPVWAVASTLLLGGLIWYVSGSWVIAGALIWGLFVHEYGHVLAMNRLGMGPARIYIIPFLGGVAKSQRLPQSEWHGVLVSLAGPAFGLLAAIPFFIGFVATGHGLWLLGARLIRFTAAMTAAPSSHRPCPVTTKPAKNGMAASRPKAGPASETSTPCHSLCGRRWLFATPPRKGMM